ncbi:MAG: hypothetical protein LUF35_11935 [Lachnospiraceae bacterium]|nr:hypothetical protein [Lachnospiraceae bacterium]
MADRELRKMNRAELIEIIYALQQNEKTIREENIALNQRLQEKTICIENSGSIAEAALSLNQIFESAQNAADQFLSSVQATKSGVEEEARQILEEAKRQADQIVGAAREEAEQILDRANTEARAVVEQTREEAGQIVNEANADVNQCPTGNNGCTCKIKK